MSPAAATTIDLRELEKAFESSSSRAELYNKIANAPFDHKVGAAMLFLGLISFFLVDPKKNVKLAAVSDTEQYAMSVRGYKFNANAFRLSLDKDSQNDIVKAILSGKAQSTNDWASIRRHKADPKQTRLNQASSGIAYSVIYPLDVPKGGALLFGYFQYEDNIGNKQSEFMNDYAKLVAKVLRKTQSKG